MGQQLYLTAAAYKIFKYIDLSVSCARDISHKVYNFGALCGTLKNLRDLEHYLLFARGLRILNC